MRLFEKKQEPGRGGMREKSEKISPPAKRDISAFGGRPYLSQEAAREWVKRSELFKTTGIPEERRLRLWNEVTKGTGYFIERGEPERILGKLRTEITRAKTPEERRDIGDTIKLVEKFLGK